MVIPTGRRNPLVTRITRLLLITVCCTALLSADQAPITGLKAPEWVVSDWINSDPLKLEDLSGRVVLVRWWTAPQCPFCAASAPALKQWYSDYRKHGLVVVGFYHHKSTAPLRTEEVRTYVKQFGFDFPVAIDHEWRTLKRWWLDGNPQAKWTSVSFLLDRRGVVRYVHPVGVYEKGDAGYKKLESEITKLLREQASR